MVFLARGGHASLNLEKLGCPQNAPVTIDSVTHRVKLTVKDYSTEGNPKMLHALAAMEIEDALLGIFPSYSGDESLQTGQPTTGRALSIADLLAGATLFNDLPFSSPCRAQ